MEYKRGELVLKIMSAVPDISLSAAYKRANQYLSKRISLKEACQPVQHQYRRENTSGITTKEIMDAVPGLSWSGASNRLSKYNRGQIDKEQLYAPFGVHIPRTCPPAPRKPKNKSCGKPSNRRTEGGGNDEWWSLQNLPRRNPKTIKIGTWEAQQL